MAPLRVAVVGVGHLGKEHARILAGLPDVELVGVVDSYAPQAQAVAVRLGTKAHIDYHNVLDEVDAASIVVTTTAHYPVALAFLQRGIPVLVEKPLAATLHEAQKLVAAAQRNHTVLQVGHIERFNPAFEELQGRSLQPKFIRGERVGPFTGRSTDIGIVLDLMIHDLDLALALVDQPVDRVEAIGVSIFGGHEDVANARLHFAGGCVADLTASRASATPSRRMSVWGPEGFARIDFAQRQLSLVQPSEHVRHHGLDPQRLDAAARARLRDDLFGHHLQMQQMDCNRGDQLTRELSHFVHCVRTGSRPRVDGVSALQVMTLADRILQSIDVHQWTGHANGPTGPKDLPAPKAALFLPPASDAAA